MRPFACDPSDTKVTPLPHRRTSIAQSAKTRRKLFKKAHTKRPRLQINNYITPARSKEILRALAARGCGYGWKARHTVSLLLPVRSACPYLTNTGSGDYLDKRGT